MWDLYVNSKLTVKPCRCFSYLLIPSAIDCFIARHTIYGPSSRSKVFNDNVKAKKNCNELYSFCNSICKIAE